MKRETFASKRGFVLACIGSAVGLGDIWLFPARVSQFGGAAFLIAYIIFVAVIGYTGVIGEMAFGRAMGTGPIGAFEQALQRRGKPKKLGTALGLIPVLGSLALAIGYSVVFGWIIKYITLSVGGKLKPDVAVLGQVFGDTAKSFGNVPWHVLGIGLAVVIMAMGVSAGIEKVNKVVMPLFFVMFVGLAIYIATLPGAIEGYKYLLVPKWEYLLQPKTWVYALGQAFFSLSLAGSGTLIYGSYLKKDADIISSAKQVAFFDTIAGMIAVLVMIPAMAYAGTTLGEGGPGLLFIYLPNVLLGMPGGRLLMIVFFVAVFFAGISSLINLLETPIEAVQSVVGFSRKKSTLCIGAITTGVAVLIEGSVSGWMDVCSIYICPLGALLAAALFFWVCGKEFAVGQANLGAVKKVGGWFVPAGRYIFCALTVVVLIMGTFYGGIG